MSVWDPTSHQTVTEAELLEGQNLDEALLTKVGSNQEYAEAQRLLQRNDWRDSDLRNHFADSAPLGWTLVSGPTHDMDNHLFTLTGTGDAIHSNHTRRADVVESIVEFRIKVSADTANIIPWVGMSSTVATGVTNSLVFTRGTNANTWKALSYSGSSLRTTTDNLAANYIDWDVLTIQYFTAGAKFLIDGSLVATHSTVLPDTSPLYATAFVPGVPVGEDFKVDRGSFRAIANDESA